MSRPRSKGSVSCRELLWTCAGGELLDKNWNGDVFNVGNGDNRSVNQLADMIGGDRVYNPPVLEPRVTLSIGAMSSKPAMATQPLN